MNNTTNEIITKRFQTTMIGALSEFEKSFGYLWGQHKDENEPLTAQEDKFLDIWEETRNRVLNNGNNQLRKAVSELRKNDGTNSRYNYSFKTKG
jgi:hypothetical protein